MAPSYSQDLFTDEVLLEPYGHYAALRHLGPAVWLEAHDVYAVARYDEARAVLKDDEHFRSEQGVALNDQANAYGAGKNLIMTDGDLHAHLRSVLARNLTPRALRSVQESVDAMADELVCSLVAKGSFDAVADLARALPLAVVPDLVGWPEEGRENLLGWAGAMFDFLGPMNDRAQCALPQVAEMAEYTARIATDESMRPGSVGSGVLEAARRGDIEAERVPSLIVGYLAPSLDTTISSLGSAMMLFAEHPEQWQAVRDDPSLIPNAFNEVVRIESPIRVFTRVAASDTEIGGEPIPAGSRLAVLYGAANRDERRFPAAEHFDVRRENAAEQLGFGYGSHGCAGQGLARMEAHALLAALTRRVGTITLAGPVTHAFNNLINARASVPVTVTSCG